MGGPDRRAVAHHGRNDPCPPDQKPESQDVEIDIISPKRVESRLSWGKSEDPLWSITVKLGLRRKMLVRSVRAADFLSIVILTYIVLCFGSLFPHRQCVPPSTLFYSLGLWEKRQGTFQSCSAHCRLLGSKSQTRIYVMFPGVHVSRSVWARSDAVKSRDRVSLWESYSYLLKANNISVVTKRHCSISIFFFYCSRRTEYI